MIGVLRLQWAHNRLQGVRFFGIVLIILHSWFGLGNSGTAGTFYRRSLSEDTHVSIVKTITGVSELVCVLKCRRDSNCKNSIYEKAIDGNAASKCHFSKDDSTPGSGYTIKGAAILHLDVYKIGSILFLKPMSN